MAIHIHSLEPAGVPMEPARSNATGSRLSSAPKFQALFDELQAQHSGSAASGNSASLAAAGAASANARSAATAAATASATAAGSTATEAVKSTTTAASPATAATSNPSAVLTAQQVFGANPWLADPTGSGPNGMTFGYNPLYFASASTAADVAQMVGGTVVQDAEFTKNTPGGPFAQQQPNEMVELSDGALINPGLIASLYTHGYQNSIVNQAIANEVAGAEASVTSPGT